MKIQLQIQLLKSLYKIKRGGFTLIELLVVVILIGVMSAIALPNLLGQIEKARVAEAKNTLGMLNRAQQAYHFENATFATNTTDLGAEIILSSKQYVYSFVNPINNQEVHHLATPQLTYINDIAYVTSAVFKVGNTFNFVLCEGSSPGSVPSVSDSTTCVNGNIVN